MTGDRPATVEPILFADRDRLRHRRKRQLRGLEEPGEPRSYRPTFVAGVVSEEGRVLVMTADATQPVEHGDHALVEVHRQ